VCFENLRAILQRRAHHSITSVKATCICADINDFAAMNEVYATFFTAPFRPRHHDPGGRACGRHRCRDRVHREEGAKWKQNPRSTLVRAAWINLRLT